MTIRQLLLQVGDLVPFVDEDYNHMPNGVKAIVVDSRVPSGYMIMLKDRYITAIWNKNGPEKIDEEDLVNAMRGQSDRQSGICHGPRVDRPSCGQRQETF